MLHRIPHQNDMDVSEVVNETVYVISTEMHSKPGRAEYTLDLKFNPCAKARKEIEVLLTKSGWICSGWSEKRIFIVELT